MENMYTTNTDQDATTVALDKEKIEAYIDSLFESTTNTEESTEVVTSGYVETVESDPEDKTYIQELSESVEDIKGKIDKESFASEESVQDSVKEFINTNYEGMSETEALQLFTLIVKYHKEPESLSNEDIVNMLPSTIKSMIHKQILENGVDPSKVSIVKIAKEILSNIYKESEFEANLNSIDEEIQTIMNMPEITDMYFEESSKEMQKTISETYNRLISEGEEKKAKVVLQVKDAFNNSLTLEKIAVTYFDNNRVRRSARRYKKSLDRLYETFDYVHRYNKLKMTSLKEAHKGLAHAYFVDKWDYDGIKESDVDKFVIVLFYAFGELDKQDFASKADIYYTLKNMSMLRYVGEGKTKFSQNFINNIKKLVLCIKTEEAKYNESNSKNNKAKSRKSNSKS